MFTDKLRTLFSRKPTSHEHAFVVTGAQPVSYPDGLFFAGPKHTSILHRCKTCGLHETKCIIGEWTLEEVLRKESPIDELERMYANGGAGR